METKICTKCLKELPVEMFGVRKGRKSAFKSCCKQCHSKESMDRYNKKRDEILEKNREWAKNNPEIVKSWARKSYQKNKEKRKVYVLNWQKENKEKKTMYNKKWQNSHALYDTVFENLQYAEPTIENRNGYVTVKCAYCGERFFPNNKQAQHRINSLQNLGVGERRLYCSDECKMECPTFDRVTRYKGQIVGGTREIPADFRIMVFDIRGRVCEKCGSDECGLHVHHIDGYREQPMFASDIENVLVVCKPCHIAIHKEPGCTFFDYSCRGRNDSEVYTLAK